MQEFDKVCKLLQKEDVSLACARGFFDVLQNSLSGESNDVLQYLSPTGRIVHTAAYENGVTKLQLGQNASITAAERLELTRHKRVRGEEEDSAPSAAVRSNDPFSALLQADQQRKTNKRSRSDEQEEYNNVFHVLPTSNACERLFSISKWILRD